jgi:biopolymer transport protein ExbD
MGKKERRVPEAEELNITSMMDMMTIILVFLLKSFSATEVTVTPSSNLKLPMSVADKQPSVALNVVVAKDAIIVDNKRVLNLEAYDDPSYPGQKMYRIPQVERPGGGFDVPSLGVAFQDVVSQFDKIGALAKKAGRDDIGGFDGKILFQIDKDIPFTVVRDVMYNAGQAKFSNFEFVVIKTGE